ncbi:MAG TPA: YciI family protein [Terriglobia bacterium]|nr:YciI family protein [Terriglobia bacterium]
MRYMFLIYNDEKAREGASLEELKRNMAGHIVLMDEANRRGIFKGADPLQPTSAATTVRTSNGKMMIIDGPFAETKEQLAGYYILDCKDLDEALEWAAKIPTGCSNGTSCVEVRPIREL